VQVVQDQPTPLCFYKSALEFEEMNMVSILSFDSRSMKNLLENDYIEEIDKNQPIFYRNKMQKPAP